MEAKKAALFAAYEKERERLLAIEADDGMYASPVFGKGNPSPELVIIGEAPGATETEQGKPFVGKAGKQLDELLFLAKLKREDIFITNAVKYRPITRTNTGMRNRTPKRKEIMDALPLLRAELDILKPRVVATLGNTPLLALCTLCGIKRLTIGDVHGQAIATPELTLYPMYHPASVIYNRALLAVCEEDAVRLGRI